MKEEEEEAKSGLTQIARRKTGFDADCIFKIDTYIGLENA